MTILFRTSAVNASAEIAYVGSRGVAGSDSSLCSE